MGWLEKFKKAKKLAEKKAKEAIDYSIEKAVEYEVKEKFEDYKKLGKDVFDEMKNDAEKTYETAKDKYKKAKKKYYDKDE